MGLESETLRTNIVLLLLLLLLLLRLIERPDGLAKHLLVNWLLLLIPYLLWHCLLWH